MMGVSQSLYDFHSYVNKIQKNAIFDRHQSKLNKKMKIKYHFITSKCIWKKCYSYKYVAYFLGRGKT